MDRRKNQSADTIRSAGVVIARKEDGAWKLLFLRAYRNWDFPKGISEEGEAPLQTACREVREETGIKDLVFHWGEAYKETEPYGSPRKIARYYIAETKRPEVRLLIDPGLGRPEHHEFRWFSLEEIEKLAPERLRPIVAWAARLLSDEARPARGPVKGLGT
jgi:8-oxo-dGTP pyrophosphatase MutT (NUDIX family)